MNNPDFIMGTMVANNNLTQTQIMCDNYLRKTLREWGHCPEFIEWDSRNVLAGRVAQYADDTCKIICSDEYRKLRNTRFNLSKS
jgi:hypothetical protein